MSPRIVIGVGVAGYPQSAAGITWFYLQWVMGFLEAGWDVWMVEDIPSGKCLDAKGAACSFEQSINREYWNHVVNEFGLTGRATLLVDGRADNREALLDFASGADLFLNISGHFKTVKFIYKAIMNNRRRGLLIISE